MVSIALSAEFADFCALSLRFATQDRPEGLASSRSKDYSDLRRREGPPSRSGCSARAGSANLRKDYEAPRDRRDPVNDRLKTRAFDQIERGRSRLFQASMERDSLSRRKCRKSQPIGPVQGRRRRHAKRACPGRDRRAVALGVSSTCRTWTDLANRDRIAALFGDHLQ